MGSPCEIRLFVANVVHASDALNRVTAEIARLEAKYSRFESSSELSRVNQTAAIAGTTRIDEEFSSLLDYANTCYLQSDGLFDITSGVLRKVWPFTTTQLSEQELPSDEALRQVKESVGWQHVQLQKRDDKTSEVSFAREGMEIDFGGIVKEYAVDRAVAICREAGIESGIVDLGGDVHVIGPHPEGEPWQIKIRHPRDAHASMCTVSLHQGAVASSGDYERCVVINGERYSHILSPKTGYPVKGLASVSVVASACIVAGSACTIAMLKEEAGADFLTELGLEHAWMNLSGQLGGTLV